MRKIVSCVLCGEGWRRPQSKLSGAEAFDQDHRATALRTSPELSWRRANFFFMTRFRPDTSAA